MIFIFYTILCAYIVMCIKITSLIPFSRPHNDSAILTKPFGSISGPNKSTANENSTEDFISIIDSVFGKTPTQPSKTFGSVFGEKPKPITDNGLTTTEDLTELFDSVFGQNPTQPNPNDDFADLFESVFGSKPQNKNDIVKTTTEDLTELLDSVFGQTPTVKNEKDVSTTTTENLEDLFASVFGSTPRTPHIKIESKISNSSFNATNLLPTQDTCGKVTKDDEIHHEYPWVVYLLANNELPYDLTKSDVGCGVLINRRYVLATARNAKNANRIIFNFNVKQAKSLMLTPQELSTIVYVEDRIFQGKGWYDFALLRLMENVHLSESVRPICLPLTTDTTKRTDTVVVPGWQTLHQAKITRRYSLIDVQKCYNVDASILDRTGGINITCMKNELHDYVAFNEEGSPITYKYDNQWYLYGIVTTVYFHDDYEEEGINLNFGDADGVELTSEVIAWILKSIRP